jgi:hypothetical protein
LDLVCVNAEFKVKTSDGKSTVDIKGGETVREVDKYPKLGFISVNFFRFVTLTYSLMRMGPSYREAELIVDLKMQEAVNFSLNSFIEEIKSIFDEKNADVLIIAEDQEYKSIFEQDPRFSNTHSLTTL